jgi:tetratricopeptide (TPR) repeat protein
VTEIREKPVPAQIKEGQRTALLRARGLAENAKAALDDVAAAQTEAGLCDDARESAAQIRDKDRRERVLASIALAYAKARNDAQAGAVLDSIGENDARDHAVELLAGHYTRAARWASARSLADKVEDDGRRASVLTALASATANAGQIDTARSLFSEAFGAVDRMTNDTERKTELLLMIARAETASALHDEAKKVLAHARKTAGRVSSVGEAHRLEALCNVAAAQAAAGQQSAAKATRAEAVRVARTSSVTELGLGRDLCRIASMDANRGMPGEARALLSEARAVMLRTQIDFWRQEILACIAMVEGQLGDADQAINDALSVREGKDRALEKVTEILTDAGAYPAALKAARLISSEWARSGVMQKIVQCQIATGKIDDAANVAREMPNDLHQLWSTRSIAVALVEARRFEEAKAIALGTSSPFANATVMLAVALALHKQGLLAQATDAITQVSRMTEQMAEGERKRELNVATAITYARITPPEPGQSIQCSAGTGASPSQDASNRN